jgi:hypothetical protein
VFNEDHSSLSSELTINQLAIDKLYAEAVYVLTGEIEMTDPKTALQELSARGITTLEQLVESMAQMRKPQRIDSEKALQEVLARLPPPDPSFKSKIGPPASSVAIVLDGKPAFALFFLTTFSNLRGSNSP